MLVHPLSVRKCFCDALWSRPKPSNPWQQLSGHECEIILMMANLYHQGSIIKVCCYGKVKEVGGRAVVKSCKGVLLCRNQDVCAGCRACDCLFGNCIQTRLSWDPTFVISKQPRAYTRIVFKDLVWI
jgi:hypothetical protein